tara:strand:- start:1211 stop:1618 length:408 start_codon:yes stop_codon:yes gene_type:complete
MPTTPTTPLAPELVNTIENYNDEKRLTYTVQQVITNKCIWVLADEHGCVMLNTEDEDCVPVWPNEEFALRWATDEWENCIAEGISLAKWHSHWSTGLADDELALVVFPNQDNQGLVLYPDEFEVALQKETNKQQR